MKYFYTLLIIVISTSAFSQPAIPAESFPTIKINAQQPKVCTGHNSISISNLDRLQERIGVSQTEDDEEMTNVKFVR